ncbi:MAG: hypothetical protein PHT33_15360, partial [bacterium]|nr:hypothetical protein [bacterium]
MDSDRDSLLAENTFKALYFSHFPTRQQAIVWRNWGIIPVERLASVLRTTPGKIMDMAREMGLSVPPQICNYWLERGYVTVIRNNWHLLRYQQLLELLNWSAERLNYILKEEDFLWHKLGDLKPETEFVCFEELTEEQIKQTAVIKNTVEK